MPNYLEDLTERLTRGLKLALPADARAKHAAYLLSQQNPDGGFRGRSEESDLYYTGFALRGLALLDSWDESWSKPAADYLHKSLAGSASIIDFLSLLYGAMLLQISTGADVFENARDGWREAVVSKLEELRREDGGYAKGKDGAAGSTYHSFLVVLCHQLLAWPTPEPERLAQFVKGRQRDDGGFVEIPQMRRSGTNPTSAAIALLRILDRLDETTAQDAIEYLVERQDTDGGLTANTQIFASDVLSTFTGLLTLADLGAARRIKLPAVRRFVESNASPDGAFLAMSLDPVGDVEYTFYALGSLALVADLESR
ncbi:MAG TPA: prenyltransferase/squalene oxidase repeat-containing protein [Pirellulales bacterium]